MGACSRKRLEGFFQYNQLPPTPASTPMTTWRMARIKRVANVGEYNSGKRQRRIPASIALITPAPTMRPKNRLTVYESNVDTNLSTSDSVDDSIGGESTSSSWVLCMVRGIPLQPAQSNAMKYGMRITSANILKSAIWPKGVVASLAFEKKEYQYKLPPRKVAP
jgi:hypothetical protein